MMMKMPTTYISIGCACGVAYQLQKLKIRKCAFPFDWLRVNSLRDATNAIKNNFDEFLKVDNIEISDKFPIIDDDFVENNSKSRVMINKYGIKFYHDFNADHDNYESVYEKYQRRITRFIEIIKSSEKICFIRDEINMNKISIDQIEEFMDCLKKFNENIKIKLIIILHNPKNKESEILKYNNENVIIVNDMKPFGDWTRPNIDLEKYLIL